jgi:hypothetical protein
MGASRIEAVTLVREHLNTVQYIWISVSFRPHWLLEMYKKLFHKLNIMHFLAMDMFKLHVHHPSFNDETVTLNNILFYLTVSLFFLSR